jgi:hypothetical protein
MKIEEAIVNCLATSNRGMRTEQIADMINRQRLHLRKDGHPVTAKQAINSNPSFLAVIGYRLLTLILTYCQSSVPTIPYFVSSTMLKASIAEAVRGIRDAVHDAPTGVFILNRQVAAIDSSV